MTAAATEPRFARVAWDPRTSRGAAWRVRALVLTSLLAGAWYFGWLLQPDRVGNPALYGLLLFAELFNLVQAVGFWWTVTRDHRGTDTPPPPPSPPPTVDVFIPVYDEPLDIVEPTIAAAVQLPGAHVRVAVLDDGNRSSLEAIARRHGARYFRRGVNTGAKAGNINHALARTDAPFVVVLDCDHVPGGRLLPSDPRLLRRRQRRVRADPAVLRERQLRWRAPGGVVAAVALLRPDRSREGPARRDVLLRHERRVPAPCTRRGRWVPRDVDHRGLRAVGRAPRTRLAIRVRAEGPGARARTGGHGVLRESAAPLGARLPVGAPPRAARLAAVPPPGPVPAVGDVLPDGLDRADLHVTARRSDPDRARNPSPAPLQTSSSCTSRRTTASRC